MLIIRFFFSTLVNRSLIILINNMLIKSIGIGIIIRESKVIKHMKLICMFIYHKKLFVVYSQGGDARVVIVSDVAYVMADHPFLRYLIVLTSMANSNSRSVL